MKLFSDSGERPGAPIALPEGTFCHQLIADTAKSLARSLYEKMASRSNEFFKEVPSEELFVAKVWPGLVEDARSTLIDMLAGNYPEELKEQIHKAIVLDNTLTRGRPERVGSRLRTAQTITALRGTASEI